jgi:phage-related protein
MPQVIQNYSFSFNGQVFGGAGSPYQILSVDGLEGLPGIRNQDDNRGYADGMFTGRDFLAGRYLTMSLNITASSTASAQANFNTLQRALLPQTSGTSPLFFLLSSGEAEQVIDARVRSLRSTVNPNYTYGLIIAQVDFFCPDPRYYDSNEQTATLLFSVPSGRIYNRTYNLVYGGGSGTLTTTITNTGWTDTYPTITINGPITNPEVGNATQGAQLLFNVVLSSADEFVIDLYNKLITLNGQPARNTLISGGSEWFSAQPGNNSFYFTGVGTLAGTTQAVVTWQSAYI